MLAELLGLPCATVVAQLTIEGAVAPGATAHAHREIEGGIEEVSFKLPAIVAGAEGLNRTALSVAQGHHGGEEEDDRGAARADGVTPRSR
jgi:electron transfer flavoprotein alpha/beta subunit